MNTKSYQLPGLSADFVVKMEFGFASEGEEVLANYKTLIIPSAPFYITKDYMMLVYVKDGVLNLDFIPQKKSKPTRWRINSGPNMGLIVYPGLDNYGCANDDTRTTGIEHVAVSNYESGVPFYTIEKHHLDECFE